MKPGVPLTRCVACGAGFFPARLICPRCGGAEWHTDAVCDGVVEQTTTVRHAAGHKEWQPRHIASVRTSDGQLIVAGLEELLEQATRVTLFDRDGSPVARKAEGGS
jgi:uncharacterized OB-fold protein